MVMDSHWEDMEGEHPNGCREFAEAMSNAHAALVQCCGRENIKLVTSACGGERRLLGDIANLMETKGPDYQLRLDDIKRLNGQPLSAEALAVLRQEHIASLRATANENNVRRGVSSSAQESTLAERIARERDMVVGPDGMDDTVGLQGVDGPADAETPKPTVSQPRPHLRLVPSPGDSIGHEGTAPTTPRGNSR